MDFGFHCSLASGSTLEPNRRDSSCSDSNDHFAESIHSYSSDGSCSDDDPTTVLGDNQDECKDTMSEEELKKLTNDQLKMRLKALGLKVSGNKSELIERLLNPHLHRKKKKLVDWKKSRAKALLNKLLHDRESRLHKMTAREIHESHPWFQEYPFDRFKENVANLKKQVQESWAIIDRDIEIVREELRNFPQSCEGNRGYPRWDKHPAKQLLRQDIKAGKYNLGEAQKFQTTRAEYLCFPLHVFRDHIHQERRRQREMPMKVVQRNKKAQKMHQKEVEEEEERWAADERYRRDLDDIAIGLQKF
jgi:hypothetical protein